MLVQEAHPGEGLLTARTGVLLGLQVRLEVGPQVGLVRKAPGAVSAREGLLTRVGPYVALEQPRPGEALAADVALAGQGVGPDVHLEGGEGRVALVAVLAAEVLLDLVCTVELLVLGIA